MTAAQGRRISWSEVLLLLLILAVALVLRLGDVRAHLHDLPQSDERTYDRYAWSFAQHESIKQWGKRIEHPLGSFTYRPPGYPLFLGLIYRAVGHSYATARLIQALLGALTCLWIYWIGRRVFHRMVGGLTALLLALYFPFIVMPSFLLSETLFLFLLYLFIVVALAAARRASPLLLFSAGALLGATTITRPVILPFIPLFFLWLPLWEPVRRRLGRNVLAVALGLGLTMGPIIVKNYQIHGHFVPIATNGGLNFYQGLATSPDLHHRELLLSKDQIREMDLSELEEERFFYQIALTYLRRYPGDIPKVLQHKLRTLFLSHSTYFGLVADRGLILNEDPYAGYLFLALGILGVFVRPTVRWRERLLLILIALAQIGLLLAYDSQSRFRLPFVPIFALLACFALIRLVDRPLWARRCWRERIPAAAVVVTLLGLSLYFARITVQRFSLPTAIQHPLQVDLGGQVALLGYDLPEATVAPGERLSLTLYWRAQSTISSSYKVFTHLVGSNGAIRGQQDSIPRGYTWPTTRWLPGEVVTDEYAIPIRDNAPPGRYTLMIGMYDEESGARLPIVSGAMGSDGCVALAAVEVRP